MGVMGIVGLEKDCWEGVNWKIEDCWGEELKLGEGTIFCENDNGWGGDICPRNWDCGTEEVEVGVGIGVGVEFWKGEIIGDVGVGIEAEFWKGGIIGDVGVGIEVEAEVTLWEGGIIGDVGVGTEVFSEEFILSWDSEVIWDVVGILVGIELGIFVEPFWIGIVCDEITWEFETWVETGSEFWGNCEGFANGANVGGDWNWGFFSGVNFRNEKLSLFPEIMGEVADILVVSLF